jgi:hypothetical protein
MKNIPGKEMKRYQEGNEKYPRQWNEKVPGRE